MHRREPAIHDAADKWTEAPAVSRERMVDALADYPAHGRLQVTKSGLRILGRAAEIQSALVEAMRGRRSSTEWAELSGWRRGEATGWRTPGDLRKIFTGELLVNVTDLAALGEDPEAFRDFALEIARLAGLRCEPMSAPSQAALDAIAQLGRTEAEVSGRYLTALSPDSPGGAQVTASERAGIREPLELLKAGVATVEHNLGGSEK